MASTISLLACAKADVTLDRVKALVGQEGSESLTLEYKERYSENLIKAVAAMANTYGGLVIVGVTDNPQENRLIGVEPGAVEQIVNGCFQRLEPPIEPEIIELPLANGSGRSIVVVRVHADRLPRPILLKGAAPIRLHGRNAVADRARLRQLFDESPLPTRHDASLPAPRLDSTGTDKGDGLIVLRSGLRLPVGNAANWRALSEVTTEELGHVLDRAPLTDAIARWCSDLHLPAPSQSLSAGHNRARRMRLQRTAVADRRMVQVVSELQLPPTYGAPYPDLLFTVDVSATHIAEPPRTDDHGDALLS